MDYEQEDIEQNNDNQSSIAIRIGRFIRDIFTGQWLIGDLARNNGLAILLILLISLIYIGFAYRCDQLRNKLAEKTTESKNLRIESIDLETELMQISRESSITYMLEERHIPLSGTNEPPIDL